MGIWSLLKQVPVNTKCFPGRLQWILSLSLLKSVDYSRNYVWLMINLIYTETIIAGFSYVNHNRNEFSVVICIGKESNHCPDWYINRSILSLIRRNFANTQPIIANSKIKYIAIDPGNALYLLELDLKVTRCPELYFPTENEYIKRDLWGWPHRGRGSGCPFVTT